MKILIGVPCMDMVHARFAQSLATMNRPEGAIFCFSIGSSVHMSREAIAKEAIEQNADYILWLDSDMIFPADVLERLLSDQKDLIGGFYLKREPPYQPVVYSCIFPDCIPTYKENIVGQVDGIGFGCMLTKVSVLKEILNEFGNIFQPIEGYGEDLSFCRRATLLKHKIYCDFSLAIGHIGQIAIDKRFLDN